MVANILFQEDLGRAHRETLDEVVERMAAQWGRYNAPRPETELHRGTLEFAYGIFSKRSQSNGRARTAGSNLDRRMRSSFFGRCLHRRLEIR